MESTYELQIVHLSDPNYKSLQVKSIVDAPQMIRFVETLPEPHKSKTIHKTIIEQLWQSIFFDKMPVSREQKLAHSITLNNLIISYYKTTNHHELIIENADEDFFLDPRHSIYNFLASSTINPLEFLTLTSQEQQQQLAKLSVAIEASKYYAEQIKYPLNRFQITKKGLSFDGVLFTQANQTEKMKFGTAIGCVLKPNHQIIRISNWLLLNPIYMHSIEKIALNGGREIWLTLDNPGNLFSLAINRNSDNGNDK